MGGGGGYNWGRCRSQHTGRCIWVTTLRIVTKTEAKTDGGKSGCSKSKAGCSIVESIEMSERASEVTQNHVWHTHTQLMLVINYFVNYWEQSQRWAHHTALWITVWLALSAHITMQTGCNPTTLWRHLAEALKGKKSWNHYEAWSGQNMVVHFDVKIEKIISCNDNSLVGVN